MSRLPAVVLGITILSKVPSGLAAYPSNLYIWALSHTKRCSSSPVASRCLGKSRTSQNGRMCIPKTGPRTRGMLGNPSQWHTAIPNTH
ncbi:hypothetical protein QBC43DRAFT_311755 [Cladorrhinum sp. PSN259]|nr:hypothetical protein QBC43DRAFT_311755 [Cladorrhinum sp. PSN259]